MSPERGGEIVRDVEKRFRLTCLVEVFTLFGVDPTKERLRLLANITQQIPPEVYRDACLRACTLARGGFPPGAGDIIAAALELAPGEPNPGQERSLPRWYLVATRKLRPTDEKPREIGSRTGPTQIADLDIGDDFNA